MIHPETEDGQFCWVDLAAADAPRAFEFYGRLFGWSFTEQTASGGTFTRIDLSSRPVGSMYQLSRRAMEQGVPSHWTLYIKVANVDDSVRVAAALGGEIVIAPFDISGIARIAIIRDAVGAHVGLWQPASALIPPPIAGTRLPQ